MIVKGTVRGDAARMFPRFMYRKPNAPSMSMLRTNKIIDVADYEVDTGTMDEKGVRELSVTMLPNAYTDAKDKLKVFTMQISGILPNLDLCVDEALRLCFRGRPAK